MMYRKNWTNLRKVSCNSYELQPQSPGGKSPCSPKVNFTQLAFDFDEEWLIATDNTGDLYYIDLCNIAPSYQKMGKVGQATFLAFNPLDKAEIIVGLTNADIKLCRIQPDASKYCLLIGHNLPAMHISFYKESCLTSSREEVIIWCLKTGTKVQQLKINQKNVEVKKASFSSLGHIVALYQNDKLQAWAVNHLENDYKIDAKSFGMRNVRDFIFTKNGRAMIVAGAKNKIIVLNTCNWSIIRNLCLCESFMGIKHLSVVPLPLDGGANKVLAVISLDCMIHFFDLDTACLLETSKQIAPIRKMDISQNGRYLAYIQKGGNLNLMFIANLFMEKCPEPKEIKEPHRIAAHTANEHLRYIKENIKQELCLERLLPILKEFGEYPEKHRGTIWSTILKLPGNKCAYNTIANEAAYSQNCINILKGYSLANKSKQTLLATTLKCLVQWCPLLVQCSFLPSFSFPFIVVFEKNSLLGFELILNILINYCQKWFEYHPLPPLNVLGIIENILSEEDPKLLNTLCELGITSSDYAWPLLKTTMSEVLSGTEWLILWDHLLSYQKPSLIILCVVAYTICSRDVIMSLSYSSESCKRFYTTQSHIRAKDIMKVARQLDKDISPRIHPKRYLRDKIITLSPEGPYPPFTLCIDYPEFLTEDKSILEVTRIKEKEQILHDRKRKEMEAAEGLRLHREIHEFMDEIHKRRLNEVQKCVREQIYNVNWPIGGTIQRLDIADLEMEDEKDKRCKKLQQDVNKLEYEVQQFLDSLKPNKSRSNIT